MPVAMAKMFGSKMMSSGTKPASSTSKPIRPRDDLLAPRDGVGLALFVEGHDDRRCPVAPTQTRLRQKGLFALLETDRIDHALALDAAQARLDDGEVAGVDHHRHAGDVGLRHGEVEEPLHGEDAVGHALVHVDVDDLGAVFDLLAGDIEGRREIARLDQSPEPGRPRHVGALADVHEQRVRVDLEWLQAGQSQRAPRTGGLARLGVVRLLGERANVVGRRAAAAADQVDESFLDELAKGGRHLLRRLVVAAELVGQARVRVHADEGGRDVRERFHVRPQSRGSECAVQADDQWLGVVDGLPECLGRLPGERPTAQVGDRAGDHDGQPFPRLEDLLEREQCGLGVQRVEDRLDHDEVGTAVDQRLGGLPVGLNEFGEPDVARAGIVDVRRDAGRTVGRTEHAGHPARPGRRLDRVGGAARDRCGVEVDVADGVAEVVVGLRDARCRERIGLDDVGPGLEIGAVDRFDDVGSGQREHIAVALQIGVVALERFAAEVGLAEVVALLHGAGGAVEHEYALLERIGEGCGHVARMA